jgi:lipopolysaccharide O-acetyltransferase
MSKLLRIAAKGPALLRQRIRSWLWQRILGCRDLQIGHGALIIGDRRMKIGAGFRAGRGLWMEAVTQYGGQTLTPALRIGERFSASDGVHIACAFDLSIGHDVLVGSKVHITDHNHGLYQGTEASSPQEAPATRPLSGATVRIGDRVFLADGVVVMPGSDIGDGAIVGANSVVRGRLPGNTIYAGAPARPLKRFDATTRSWIRVE